MSKPIAKKITGYLTPNRIYTFSLLLLAVLCTTYVLVSLPKMPRTADYTYVFIAWCLSIFFYCIAITPLKRPLIPNLHDWWQTHSWTILILSLIVLSGSLFRVWNLTDIPFNLHGDEGEMGLEAVRVINGEIRNPFTSGWLGHTTLGFYFQSISIYFLGQTKFALRLPWALIGTGAVLASFFLFRRLNGVTVGLIASALLATYHFHIHYSRLGLNNIADTLFVSLTLLFLQRGLDENRKFDWLLTGIICGFSLYFYTGARIIPIIIFGILMYHLLFDRFKFIHQYLSGVLIAFVGFIIVYAPMIQFAFRFPNEFNARLKIVGIFQPGWLEQEMLKRDTGLINILLDQFLRSALAFNYYPDTTFFYRLPQPLLDPIFGVIFLLGLGYGTLRSIGPRADRRLFPMVFWWWSVIIVGGMLTLLPPASMRFITISVPTCFFLGLAIWKLTRPLEKLIGHLLSQGLIILVVLFFGIGSLKLYFLDYSPKRLYASAGRHTEISVELSPILNKYSDTHYFYFFGAPHVYWGFAPMRYLAPDAQGKDVLPPLQEPPNPDFIDRSRGAVFIFLPTWRIEELELIRQTFPNGNIQKIRSPADDQIILIHYMIPPK